MRVDDPASNGYPGHGRNATIGGGVPGASNTISGNTSAGVVVQGDGATGDAILSNSIFANKFGIDLGDDGVTPNTPGGPHVGPNNLQNFPVLLVADSSATSTFLSGTLDGAPNTTFTIQLFASTSADPSGFGQGQTYLGQVTGITTDASGNAGFQFVAAGNFVGQAFSATATDPAGNTSEFARDVPQGVVRVADIAVSVAQSTMTVAYGGLVTYSFVVANHGPSAAPNLVVTDMLPPSLTDVTATATMGEVTLVGNAFTATVGSLPAGLVLGEFLGDGGLGRHDQPHTHGVLPRVRP